MLADYAHSIPYHPSKANMVVDSLSETTVSMGSLAHLTTEEWPLALYIQSLANKFVLQDISDSSQVVAFIGAQSSLINQIWARQFEDKSLVSLKDRVL